MPGRGQGLLEEVADDGLLKAGDEVECRRIERSDRSEVSDVDLSRFEAVSDGAAMLDGTLHAVSLHITEHGGLDAAKREVKTIAC